MADALTRLALAARGGDRTALEEFVRRSQRDVVQLCLYIAGPADVDDIVQETYLRAMTSLGSYRGDSQARFWLLAIARNTCIDHLRRCTRDERRDASAPQRRSITPDTAEAVALMALVNSLDPDRREAFILTQLVGLSYDEVATVVDAPIGTVRSRVSRARQDIIRQFGESSGQSSLTAL